MTYEEKLTAILHALEKGQEILTECQRVLSEIVACEDEHGQFHDQGNHECDTWQSDRLKAAMADARKLLGK